MVIYEVNLNIDEGIREEFLPWLETHIQEMLAISGFVSAELFQVANDPLQFCVHYLLQDLSVLNNYLENKASQMRGSGLKKFANKMHIHRRILLRKGLF